MARAVAIALIALVAVCLVADAAAQSPFCRTSSYLVNSKFVEANKKAMFGACKADIKVLSVETKSDGCAVIVQQVKDEAAWKAYSACEKDAKNEKSYSPLSAASGACKKHQAEGKCP